MNNNRKNTLAKTLIGANLTIAVAESATAGRLTAEFSLFEDAGKFLKGGIICYDANLKERLLKVSPSIIKTFTPESMETTKAIAYGLSNLISADIHIGVTGLVCPGGSETPEKPVGTMFIYAIRDKQIIFSERLNFSGHPEQIVTDTVERCFELLEEYLQNLQLIK